MRLLILIISLLLYVSVFSQSDTTFITHDSNPYDDKLIYVTDTIVSKTPNGSVILAGTTILPFTQNMINAMGHGFELTKVKGSPCQNNGREPVYKKDSEVVSIAKTDSTWNCELKIIDNCCYDFLCEINIVNDSILNFIYHGYGDHCGCNCCFGLLYEIKIEDYGDVSKVTQTMLNGQDTTLKKIE